MRLDLAFMGRSTVYSPIYVRPAAEIEFDARWGRTMRIITMVSKAVVTAVVSVALVWALAVLL
jgi:hypothetical protein